MADYDENWTLWSILEAIPFAAEHQILATTLVGKNIHETLEHMPESYLSSTNLDEYLDYCNKFNRKFE